MTDVPKVRRKKLANAEMLQLAEEKFKVIYDHSLDLMVVIRPDTGTILSCNEAVKRLLGYTTEEVIGRHFSFLHAPEPELTQEQLLEYNRIAGAVFEAQGVLKADGATIPMDLTATTVPWMGGEAILATFRDVTDREKAQAALIGSEERYRSLFANMLNGLAYNEVELDDAGKVSDWFFRAVNGAFERLTSIPREKLVGRRVTEVFPTLRESSFDWITVCGSVALSGDVLVFEHLFEPLNRWWAVSVFSPKALFIAMSIEDITDRRMAEEQLRQAHDRLERRVRDRTAELRAKNLELAGEIEERKRVERIIREGQALFRAVFESAEDLIFVKDRGLRYTHVNPSMLRMLGVPLEDLLGKTDEEVFGVDVAKRHFGVESRVLEGQTVESEEMFDLRSESVYLHWVRVPLRDSNSDISGLCFIARNVTERKEREIQLVRDDIAAAGDDCVSPAMRRTIGQVRLAAKKDSTCLLLGDSGTGKDYLARYLHDYSPRAGGPFFSVNCAAVAPELAESELFGHEPGAFTGAVTRKRGLLELAESGTLLLNEIGELSLTLQAKLLEFLDTQTITRVGGVKNILVNARLVAATNRNLEKEAEAGRFRIDLFYRLNVVTIHVPPLRDRLEDMPALVHKLSTALAKKMGL
ncbi:MAG: sigma 54-interacting transcriptional regulator, partial [Pseudomonadota bacterium]